jgi:carboxypeptidase T
MRAWTAVLAAVLLLLTLPSVPAGGAGRADDLGVYHTYAEMVSELTNLATAHPDILALESIGKTYEGRDIWAVKLSDNVAVDEAEPNITIFGGIHAGELISVEVALYILDFLVSNYTVNATVGWWVNSTQLWFVPMINPDGHVYVEQGNPWRKNRSPNPGGTFGTDLNRNFGHLWGLQASHNPPDDDYCGLYAFSENETQAVAKLVTDHHPNITLSYHAYGQYILYPWGNSINPEPVDPRLSPIAWNMSQAMPEGRRYFPMSAKEMYAATGDTDDWFYINLSILPFTIELSTSFRPADSAVPGICADNLGPALYVLNYTVGSPPPPPPPPPPKHALSLEGPSGFDCLPLESVWLNFTLRNTGDAEEVAAIDLRSLPEDWTFQLDPSELVIGPGNSTRIRLLLLAPDALHANETVPLALEARAQSGANASLRFEGSVGLVRGSAVEVINPGALRPGQNATITVTVLNTGNDYDNISVTASADTGWPVTQIPSPFELPPWGATTTFIKLQVPEVLPIGITRSNITFALTNTDGSFNRSTGYSVSVETILKLGWEVSPSGVVLYEGQSQAITVRLVNNGNLPEKGNLSLKGDARYASLDRTAVALQPGESASYTVTVKGKPGSRHINVSLASAYGYPDRQVGLDYTVKARPPAPRSWVQDAIVAMDLIFVAILIAYIVYRFGRKRPKGGAGK